MKLCRIIKENKNGNSLPLVIIITITMIAVFAVLVIVNQKSTFSTKREEQKEKALYIAEAAINNYLFKMNKNTDYFLANSDWTEYGQGEYNTEAVQLENAVGVTLTSTGRINVKNNGVDSYQERSVKVTIKKRSFLNSMYFTDREVSEGSGSKIWFIGGDVLRGPVHSNDYINIKSNPVFQSKVTTARTINYYTSAAVDNPDFQQGYEENVDRLDIPSTNDQLKIWAQNGGYYYYGSTTIVLNSNGTLNIQNSNALSTGPTGAAVSLPGNGVLFVDGQTLTKYSSLSGNIFIQGTLSGRLTISSKNDIYITGNILYNNQATDMLGLVAENYLYYNHYNSSNVDVAPTNLTVNGALFATKHSVAFESYQSTPVKGTLTIYGALGQNFRGAVGTFSGSTKVSGYTKSYDYDQRMLYDEPPHFIQPLNSGYYISNWEEI